MNIAKTAGRGAAAIFLLCARLGTLAAQDAAAGRRVSLDEYRALALANNLDVHIAESELEKSKLVRSGAFTRYFPAVSATAALAKPNIFGGGAQAGISSDFNNQSLYTFDVPNKVIHIDETIDFSDPLGVWLGTVTFTQTLFAGGRIVNSNRLAQKAVDASAYKLHIRRGEIFAQAESKYYQYALLGELITTLDGYKQTLDNLYAKVAQALEQGVVSRSDYLRVSLKREEIAIQRDEMAQMRVVAGDDFKLFAGIKDGSAVSVDGVFGDIAEPPDDAGDAAARLPLRPEFQLLVIQRDAAKLEEAIAFGGYLPSIELGVSFLRTDFSFNSALFANTSGYYQDFVGFLLFNIPLSAWWEGVYKTREKGAARRSAEEQLAVNADYLMLDLRNKLTAWQTAYKRVKLAEIGVQYAKTNREEFEQKYSAGLSSLSDYLMALALEHENSAKLDQARANYHIAATAFQTASGTAR
ncbi:MAG: TolC family protein [Spirochaetaceae bacterium]|jgi:outer membrane protein TolC|nr:TolC family protein [Spirochaetaceae bacterium]